MTKYFFIISACLLLEMSCKVDPKIIAPLPSNDLREIVPPGFPSPAYTFSANVFSQERFVLGRALFYERMMSADNTISCGSCHQQRVAFANEDHKLSHGIADKNGNDQFGTRNSPALFNLAWHPYFMYDGTAMNIETQPVLPICNPVEMGESIAGVVSKLQASEKYKNLFKAAYGSDTVTSQHVLQSLTQFIGLIYSYNSKWDHASRSENNVKLTDQEMRGYGLFRANCNTCHAEPLFTDFKFRDIGLKPDPALPDSGRARKTGDPADLYKFKTPNLRNIARTGPYMHDGRYAILEDCLNHYKPVPAPQNFPTLSADDKQDIISFLNALTDDQFALPLDKMDPRFSDPN